MGVRKWVFLGLSTVALYGLLVHLDGSTLNGLSANGTSVQIGSLELAPNSGGTVDITVKGVPDGPGLGGYILSVEFDPQVLQVREVRGGDPPFNNVAAADVDNAAGEARLLSFQTPIPGPVGNLVLAKLDVTAIGTSGMTSNLNITITDLIDALGDDLVATTTSGMVSIPNQSPASGNPQAASPPVPTIASIDPLQPPPEPTVRPAVAPNPAPPVTGGQVGGGGLVPIPTPEAGLGPSVPAAPTTLETPDTSIAMDGIPTTAPSLTDTVQNVPVPLPPAAAPSDIVESPIPDAKATELVKPGPGDGLAIWVWVLIGFAGIAVVLWGGILYLHLKDRS